MMAMVRGFVTEFEWIHDAVGNFGNICFFVGSVFFLWESTKTWGVWLFIVGAAGMLVGSLGSTFVHWERRIRRERDIAGGRKEHH